MTKFYTTQGDDGFTGLLGEGRVEKSSPRLAAVGTVDEATAALGLARAFCQAEGSSDLILQVQRDLYKLMSEVSATPENAKRFRNIGSDQVAWLEEQTDALSEKVEIPRQFILPGDSPSGAALALARTVVRRAERTLVPLIHGGEIENIELLRYLNRLSSLCFVLELYENQASGQAGPTLAKE